MPNLGGVNDEASSMIIERVTSPSVIVYTDSNFRGWSTELPVGSHASIAVGNDKVSSAIVPQGYRVTLYQNASFKGETRELTADAASLGGFNDRTSSIVVDRLSERTPTLDELNQLIKKVGPRVYFHPDDPFGEGKNLSNGTSQSWAGVTWFEFGLLNSTAKGSKLLDCGSKYQLLSANFLTDAISAPDWTQYRRRWGPHITYPQSVLMEVILSGLGSIPDVAKVAKAIWDAIPGEFKEENGPTGPWTKGSWSGDE